MGIGYIFLNKYLKKYILCVYYIFFINSISCITEEKRLTVKISAILQLKSFQKMYKQY